MDLPTLALYPYFDLGPKVSLSAFVWVADDHALSLVCAPFDADKSRNEYPAKTSDVSPTADALVEIIHGKCHPTIIAKAQATARPHDDTPRGTLTHNALGTAFTHAGCAFCP